MNFLEIIILLFISGIACSISQVISGYSIGGCFLSVILGFIGAVSGIWIAHHFHFPEVLDIKFNSGSLPLFWALTGAILFSLMLNILNLKSQ